MREESRWYIRMLLFPNLRDATPPKNSNPNTGRSFEKQMKYLRLFCKGTSYKPYMSTNITKRRPSQPSACRSWQYWFDSSQPPFVGWSIKQDAVTHNVLLEAWAFGIMYRLGRGGMEMRGSKLVGELVRRKRLSVGCDRTISH